MILDCAAFTAQKMTNTSIQCLSGLTKLVSVKLNRCHPTVALIQPGEPLKYRQRTEPQARVPITEVKSRDYTNSGLD